MSRLSARVMTFFLLFNATWTPGYSHTIKTQNKSSVKVSFAEIMNPVNWVASGCCWDFFKKIITAQGIGARPIAYFKSKIYTDFKFEIKLRIVTDDDGSCAMNIRFFKKSTQLLECFRFGQ